MFDSKELAKKALLRAEEIKKARRHRKFEVIAIGSALCIGVGIFLLPMYYSDFDAYLAGQDSQVRYIVEPYVPLARPPTEDAELCSECEAEMEEEHCCHDEVHEQCEFCKRE